VNGIGITFRMTGLADYESLPQEDSIAGFEIHRVSASLVLELPNPRPAELQHLRPLVLVCDRLKERV
jgi:hypothetical protein